MSDDKPTRIDAYLVAGGRFHDIDYARLQLLNLLADHLKDHLTAVNAGILKEIKRGLLGFDARKGEWK